MAGTADLLVRIQADVSSAIAGLNAASSAVKELQSSVGQSTAALTENGAAIEKQSAYYDGATGALNRYSSSTRGLYALGAILSTVGAGILAAGTAAITFGDQYESAITKVAALTDTNAAQLAGYQQQIKQLGETVPVNATDMAKGLFFDVSAGFQGADAANILKVATEDQTAGLGDSGTIAKVLTSTLHDYKLPASDATAISDDLINAVTQGNLDPSALASALPRVMPIASSVGIDDKEVLASLAELSRLGLSPEEGATSMRSTIQNLIKPGAAAKKQLASLGLDPQALIAEMQNQGFANTLFDLVGRTGGDVTQLDQIIPNVRALTGVLGEASQDADGYRQILATFGEDSGKTADAFGIASQTMESHLGLLKNAFDQEGISLQSALEGPATAVIDTITRVVQSISDLPAGAQLAIAGVGGLVGVMGVLSGAAVFLIPAIAALPTALGVLGTVADGAGVALAGLLGPIGLVAAGVAGFALAYSTNFLGVRDATDTVTARIGEDVDGILYDLGLLPQKASDVASQVIAALAGIHIPPIVVDILPKVSLPSVQIPDDVKYGIRQAFLDSIPGMREAVTLDQIGQQGAAAKEAAGSTADAYDASKDLAPGTAGAKELAGSMATVQDAILSTKDATQSAADAQDYYNSQIAQGTYAVDAQQSALDGLRGRLDGVKQSLSDAKQALQDFLSAPLTGENEVDRALAQTDVRIAQIQLDRDTKAQARIEKRPARTQGQQLRDLTIDKKVLEDRANIFQAQHQELRILDRPPEVSFGQAATGIAAAKAEIADLTPVEQSLTTQVQQQQEHLKIAQDQLKDLDTLAKLADSVQKVLTPTQKAIEAAQGPGVPFGESTGAFATVTTGFAQPLSAYDASKDLAPGSAGAKELAASVPLKVTLAPTIANPNAVPDAVKASVPPTTGADVGRSISTTLTTGLQSSIQTQVPTALAQVPQILQTFSTNLVPDLLKVGLDLGAGLGQGLLASLPNVQTDLGTLATGLITKIKGDLGISSPSRVFAQIGGNIAEGLVVGIQSGRTSVDRAMRDLTGAPPPPDAGGPAASGRAYPTVSGSSSQQTTVNVHLNGVTVANRGDEQRLGSTVANAVVQALLGGGNGRGNAARRTLPGAT